MNKSTQSSKYPGQTGILYLNGRKQSVSIIIGYLCRVFIGFVLNHRKTSGFLETIGYSCGKSAVSDAVLIKRCREFQLP